MAFDILFDTIQHAHAGSIVYPPGGRYGPRFQQDLQIVLLYTGEMTITIDGRVLRILPSHMVLLKPGHEEMFTFSKTEETWHRWISVHITSISEEMSYALDQFPECLPLTNEMSQLTELMLNIQRHTSNEDHTLCSLGLAALHLYPTEIQRLLYQSKKHPAILLALSWMNEHYAEDISLKDLASSTSVSSEHLVRLFKQQVGKTPMQYVWEYRLDRGIELLINTGLTISEVAERCGFKTATHFARLIKQYKGKTASEIRQLSWSGIPNT